MKEGIRMGDKNTLNISDGKLKIAITELDGTKLSSPEMVSKSILMLIGSLDVKNFEEHGIRDKFDSYMKQILDEIHGVYEWAGYKN